MKRHGKENFYEDSNPLYVICSTSMKILHEKLDFYEKFFIEKYNTTQNGYNCTDGGIGYLKPEEDLKYGIRSGTTEYRKAVNKEYRKNNPETIKAKREREKEWQKEYAKEWRKEHAEELKIKKKQYREQPGYKEKYNEYRRQWRARRKEQLKQDNEEDKT